MTTETQLRDHLRSAVHDTTLPPSFADAVLAGGRTRRRQRAAVVVVATAVAAIVAVAASGMPLSHTAREGRLAGPPAAQALEWARSLPSADPPRVPFFVNGELWADGTTRSVPDAVDQTVPPLEVAGGWLVAHATGDDAERRDRRLAVLYDDGTLRDLPVRTTSSGLGETVLAVSPDGRTIALSKWVVDVATLDVQVVAHAPARDQAGGHVTEVDPIGFHYGSLVYVGAPFDRGIGTLWLRREDGVEEAIPPPDGSQVSDGAADVAIAVDRAGVQTCVTAFRLVDTGWPTAGEGCAPGGLGEGIAVAPGGRWYLTSELPRVWDLEAGEWADIDMPPGVGTSQMDAQMRAAVWEGDDTFLLPVSDRWDVRVPIGRSYEHTVQVVRCTVFTGRCERAGDELEVTATTTSWGSTELRLPGQ